jgi:hypothetical protein
MKKISAAALTLLCASLAIISCTKFRNVPSKTPAFVAPTTNTIGYGSLRINEFICKGSDPNAVTLIGGTAKWFELYNPTKFDITLTANQWFVTDDLTNKSKCVITQNTAGAQWKVPALGFLIVACPSTGSSSTTPSPSRFNSNFSLSSSAGDIGIFYQSPGSSTLTPVDTLTYVLTGLSGVTYGRFPDGQGSGTTQLSKVTPEASNN